MGVDGIHLGLNKSQIEKCTLHSARSKRWVMTQSAMPSFMKSRVNDRPTHFIKVMIGFCSCYDRRNYNLDIHDSIIATMYFLLQISQRHKRAAKAIDIPKQCFAKWDPSDPPSAHKFLER